MSRRASRRSERLARERRQRAREHLEKVRSRKGRRRSGVSARSPRDGRRLARTRASGPGAGRRVRVALAAVAVAAFGGGILAAGPALGRLAEAASERAARVHHIAVQGAVRLDPEDVARATGVAPGADLAAVEAEAVSDRLRKHAWIAEASVLPLPNGRLLVRVEERVPRAVLSAGAAPGTAWWVDAEGRPFAPVEAEDAATAPAADAVASSAGATAGSPPRLESAADLPRLESVAAIEVGRSHDLLREAIALAERADSAWLRLPVEGSAVGWVVRPRGRDVEVVLGWSQLPERIERLEWLLRSPELATAEVARIDLRFADRAVLR